MSTNTLLEQRVSALEKAVGELQEKVNHGQPAPDSQTQNWLERVIGSISDRSAFAEALEYGREFRESDRPRDEDGETA